MLPEHSPQLLALDNLSKEQKLLLIQALQSSLAQTSSLIQPTTSIELPKTNGHSSQVINLYVQMPSVTQNANPVIETKATAHSDADSNSSNQEKPRPQLDGFEAFLICLLIFFVGSFGILHFAIKK